MIISHSHRFIFIHNYKVAGTSIRRALSPYGHFTFRHSKLRDMVRFAVGAYPRIYSNDFHGHIRARELRKELPAPVFDAYYKFGFVRNPWDWQVSLYTFMLKDKNHHQHELAKSFANFDEYIDWRVHEEIRYQKDFFYDGDKCLVDFIGKMESLHDDFAQVCSKLGIHAEVPHLNASRAERDGFLRYYSPESFALVREAFSEDIALFGYTDTRFPQPE